MPITPITNSILHLNRCLSIVIRLLKFFPQLAESHRDSLVNALYRVTTFEVIKPSATTEKQYIIYLRILCHTLYYSALILKQLRLKSTHFQESTATCILKILIYYPKHVVFHFPTR